MSSLIETSSPAAGSATIPNKDISPKSNGLTLDKKDSESEEGNYPTLSGLGAGGGGFKFLFLADKIQ